MTWNFMSQILILDKNRDNKFVFNSVKLSSVFSHAILNKMKYFIESVCPTRYQSQMDED